MSTQSPLSAAERGFIQGRLSKELYDILIIGGGINGAGVAREAASRGLKVALVEAQDFAHGTSSRSSKLIHGGLRYLAQGEFGLVREAANERQVLRRIAPHLAEPLNMLVPAYGRTRASLLKLSAGLWTFELLASVPPEEHYRVLGADEARSIEPGLRSEHLCGAITYYEFATDDARLVIDTIKSACRQGATVLNYARVVAITHPEEGQSCARVKEAGGTEFEIHARCLVNAAGPWIESVSRLEGSSPVRLHLTKGIHLVFHHSDLPIRHCVVMQARDKRPLFAVPRGEIVYIGTTDTDYSGPVDEPPIEQADVDYLLEAVHRCFPNIRLSSSRLVSAWAGLRPLLHQEGKKPSEISRKDEITVTDTGLVTVAGGKLTTYRVMAKRVVDRILTLPAIEAVSSKVQPDSATNRTPLSGGDLGGAESLDALLIELSSSTPLAKASPQTRRRLVRTYGGNALAVAECAQGEAAALAPLAPGVSLTAAEVRYAVKYEMACTLGDLFERRSRVGLFTPGNALEAAESAAREMGQELGWSREQREHELARLLNRLSAVAAIDQPRSRRRSAGGA